MGRILRSNAGILVRMFARSRNRAKISVQWHLRRQQMGNPGWIQRRHWHDSDSQCSGPYQNAISVTRGSLNDARNGLCDVWPIILHIAKRDRRISRRPGQNNILYVGPCCSVPACSRKSFWMVRRSADHVPAQSFMLTSILENIRSQSLLLCTQARTKMPFTYARTKRYT